MNKKRLVGGAVGLIMMLGPILAIRDTEARHRQQGKFRGEIRANFSGSSVTRGTPIDTNGDGVTASLGLFAWKSNLGMGTTQAVTETSASPSPVNTICPSGNLEFPMVMGRYVARLESSGDLIFARYTGTICVDPATGIASASHEGDIIGGTGRFEGATGSTELNATLTTLVSDPARNSFTSVTGTVRVTIDNPNP